MKKVILAIISLTVILTGCSSEKKPVNDTLTKSVSSSNSKQSQSQSGSAVQAPKNTSSTTDSRLLKNIDTTKSPFEKGYYDYQGTINDNIQIQMSVYPLEKGIIGSYFYDSQRKELKLKGKAGAKDIVLYEYDETGKNTGNFKGTMKTVDKIEGVWISADNKISYPFSLALKSILPGVEYGKRYSVAVGTRSDEDVENFVSAIQGYVVNNNKKELAEQVGYPITVKIDDKATKIENEDDFIKNYDKIFNSDYKQVISKAFTKYLFANWQGVMFGTGEYNMWLNEVIPSGSNSKLMITAINN